MIILDIDMPQNCWQCTLNARCGECEGYPDSCAAKGFYESKVCEYGKDNGRPEWCPIVGEIPKKHGRLIDADELYETAFVMGKLSDPLMVVEWRDVVNAPTILERSKE